MTDKNNKKMIVPRFTLDAWKQIFPDLTETDWNAAMNPHRIRTFVYKIAVSEKIDDEDFEISILTIDESFLEWASTNQKNINEDLEKTLKDYAKQLSKEQFDSLLCEMNDDYILQCFLLYLPNMTNKKILLSKEVGTGLESYIMQNVECDDVYMAESLIPVDILDDDLCYAICNDLIKRADVYFNTGCKPTTAPIKETKNRDFYILPVVIKKSHDSSIFTREIVFMNENFGQDVNLKPFIKLISEYYDCDDASIDNNTLPIANSVIRSEIDKKQISDICEDKNIIGDIKRFIVNKVGSVINEYNGDNKERCVDMVLDLIMNTLNSEKDDINNTINLIYLITNSIKGKYNDDIINDENDKILKDDDEDDDRII